MAEELKDQRIPIMMSPSEVKAVEDWMFENRIRSRGEAIRRLINNGLEKDLYKNALLTAEDLVQGLLKGGDVLGLTQTHLISKKNIIDYMKKSSAGIREDAMMYKEEIIRRLGSDDLTDEERSELQDLLTHHRKNFE